MKTELSQLSSVFTTLHVMCALFATTILLVCMNLFTFQIRMKTAEDYKRLIEGFSSDISADNALQVSAIRNGLAVHIYSNITQQSIAKTSKMVAFIHAGECGNIHALQPSIQKLMETIKSMKKHLERILFIY